MTRQSREKGPLLNKPVLPKDKLPLTRRCKPHIRTIFHMTEDIYGPRGILAYDSRQTLPTSLLETAPNNLIVLQAAEKLTKIYSHFETKCKLSNMYHARTRDDQLQTFSSDIANAFLSIDNIRSRCEVGLYSPS